MIHDFPAVMLFSKDKNAPPTKVKVETDVDRCYKLLKQLFTVQKDEL